MAANPAEIARSISTLGAFCGPRDVAELTPSALAARGQSAFCLQTVVGAGHPRGIREGK